MPNGSASGDLLPKTVFMRRPRPPLRRDIPPKAPASLVPRGRWEQRGFTSGTVWGVFRFESPNFPSERPRLKMGPRR